MSLACLPLRTPARIARIDGDRPFRRRLMELGFLPGVVVQVLGFAPFGDPMDVEIRGCRFSLRLAEASSITVQPEPAAG